MKKIIGFVKGSFRPWMIFVSVIALVIILIISAISVSKQKATLDKRMADTTSALAVAEEKAEQDYKAELVKNDVAYRNCLENTNKNLFRPCRESYTYKKEPTTLKSELKELNEIANKSWLQLFLEKVFVVESQADIMPPIYFLLIFIVAIPVFRFLIVLYRASIRGSKLVVSTSRLTGKEIKQLPTFQRYLLILMGLIVIMFAIILALQIL